MGHVSCGHGSADWWVTWVTGHKMWPIVSSDAWSLPVAWQRWRSHHSICYGRNPQAACKPHGSMLYRSGVVADRSFTLRQYAFLTFLLLWPWPRPVTLFDRSTTFWCGAAKTSKKQSWWPWTETSEDLWLALTVLADYGTEGGGGDLDLDPITFIYELHTYSRVMYRLCENKLPTSRLSKVIVLLPANACI